MPVYQLLGGRSARRRHVYATRTARPSTRCWSRVGRYLEPGYRAVRVQAGVPGLEQHLRRRPPAGAVRAGRAGVPHGGGDWSTEQLPRLRAGAVRGRARAVRLRLPPAARRAPPAHADRGGPARQEPSSRTRCSGWRTRCRRAAGELPADPRSTRRRRSRIGEVFNSIWDCRQLITEQLIDYIRTTVVHAGGITHLRRISDLADLYHVRTGCHGATDLSPVCLAASLHLDFAVPNFGIQEHMRHTEDDRRGLPARLPLRGRLPVPRRRARPRRRHRRGGGRGYPYRRGLPAGQPPGGRNHA